MAKQKKGPFVTKTLTRGDLCDKKNIQTKGQTKGGTLCDENDGQTLGGTLCDKNVDKTKGESLYGENDIQTKGQTKWLVTRGGFITFN